VKPLFGGIAGAPACRRQPGSLEVRMAHVVDFEDVSTAGLDVPLLAQERSKLAGTIRGSFFVIKGEY